MCMEALAGAALKGVTGKIANSKGMSNAQLPNMPGAQQVDSGVPQIGAPTTGAPSLPSTVMSGLLANKGTQDAGQSDGNLLGNWEKLQPERPQNVDLMTLLKLMGRQ